MMVRSLIVLTALLVAVQAAGLQTRASSQDAVARPTLKVSIAVPERGLVAARDDRSHFHVVIENVSDQPRS